MTRIDNNGSLFESLGLGASATTGSPAVNKELGQNEFFELMIAQMRNQDPFKPLENGEFLTQIAQFTMAKGVQDLQNSFNQFAGSMTSNQALQASALVGRNVLVAGDVGTLAEGSSLRGTAELPASTTELTLSVFDANGALVREVPLGGHAAGPVAFAWDGLTNDGQPAAPGRYRISAVAAIDGDNVAVGTLIEDRVESVTLGGAGQGVTVNLAAGGQLGLSDLREIK